MRTHPRPRIEPAARPLDRSLDTLRLVERALEEAADLTFEQEVRRRVLRAVEKVRIVIGALEEPPPIPTAQPARVLTTSWDRRVSAARAADTR